MIKRKGILALVAASMLTFIVGCTSSGTNEGTTEEGTSTSLPKVGFTVYKYDDNFMSYVRRAIQTASKDKAEIFMNDSQNDQAKQLEQVDTMIAKGVKSLAINLVDPKAAPSVIEKAKTADIPVIFYNKEPEESAMNSYDKTWYVGTDSKESGIIQGQLVSETWTANKETWDKNGDGKIQYVLLKGEPGHPDAEARTQYVIETVKENGIEVEELAMDAALWDAAKATEKMDAWLAKNGDKIEFVICNNDGMALGAIASLEKEGYFSGDKFMPVVGVDAIPEALEMIKAGKMVGSVLNDAKNQGSATLDIAVNAANGKDVLEGTSWKLDDKKAVRVPYVAITKDNITVAEDCYK